MEILGLLALAVLVIGSVIVGAVDRRRKRAAWEEYALRFGLASDPGSLLAGPSVKGSIEGFPVGLETVTHEGGKTHGQYTRLVVSGRGKVPRDLTLGPEGFLSSVMRAIGRGDVDTGDSIFDDATRVGGDPIVALAVLDFDTRRRVERALAKGVTLRDGELVWETPGFEADLGLLGSTTRALVDLAKGLSLEGRSVPERLLENVRSDSDADVRRRSFEALLERYPHRGETAEAARTALRESWSSEWRVLAAETLSGDEREGALASLALDEGVPDLVRERALRSLARRADAARAGPTIEAALRSSKPLVHRAAIVAAGEVRLASALPFLVSMAGAAIGETADELAATIGAIVAAEGEAAALALLAREEPLVRVAAARALGRIGGKDAVAPLLALAGGLLPFGELRAAATESVREIQARLGPAERGGLALSEILRADGALSEPSAPQGGLSTPPPPFTREPAEPDSRTG